MIRDYEASYSASKAQSRDFREIRPLRHTALLQNTAHRQRFDVFTQGSQRSRFVLPNLPPLADLCRVSDEKLFINKLRGL